MSKMMTVAEVADALNLSCSAVYELIATKKLSAYLVGARRGSIRVSDEQLDEYLDSCKTEGSGGGTNHRRSSLRHIKL